jgi:hypothetical protein
MSEMMRLFANQVAKEVVYEALKQYPSAIPWFVGIHDEFTQFPNLPRRRKVYSL